MSNQFFQPSRMESQFVATDLISVIYQTAGTNATVNDGVLAVLGDFYTEPVYTSAYGATSIDTNTRLATLPASATVAGVGVINLAEVPTTTGVSGTYRMGSVTVGLSAQAGTPVRFRKFKLDDTFYTGSDNFTSAPTVGQYAIVSTTGNWTPSATIPGTGLVAKVQKSSTLTQGVSASVTKYFMNIIQLQ